MLFFTNEIFQVLVLYTNINADKYFQVHIDESIRSWTPVILSEIRIYIAIAIYIGLERNQNIKDYWKKPIRHKPMQRMTFVRYKQIKKFFHVSNPWNNPLTHKEKKHKWYMKLSPLFQQVRFTSI